MCIRDSLKDERKEVLKQLREDNKLRISQLGHRKALSRTENEILLTLEKQKLASDAVAEGRSKGYIQGVKEEYDLQKKIWSLKEKLARDTTLTPQRRSELLVDAARAARAEKDAKDAQELKLIEKSITLLERKNAALAKHTQHLSLIHI